MMTLIKRLSYAFFLSFFCFSTVTMAAEAAANVTPVKAEYKVREQDKIDANAVNSNDESTGVQSEPETAAPQVVKTNKRFGSSAYQPSAAILPMLGGLVLVLIIIFALSFLLKKINIGGLNRTQVKILESHSLGMKNKLVMVEVEGQRLLLGVSVGSVNKIHQFRNEDKINSNNSEYDKAHSADNTFSSLLKKVLTGDYRNSSVRLSSPKSSPPKSSPPKSSAPKSSSPKSESAMADSRIVLETNGTKE